MTKEKEEFDRAKYDLFQEQKQYAANVERYSNPDNYYDGDLPSEENFEKALESYVQSRIDHESQLVVAQNKMETAFDDYLEIYHDVHTIWDENYKKKGSLSLPEEEKERISVALDNFVKAQEDYVKARISNFIGTKLVQLEKPKT